MTGKVIMIRDGSYLAVVHNKKNEISHGVNFSKDYERMNSLGAAAAREAWKKAVDNSSYEVEDLATHLIGALMDDGHLQECKDMACSAYNEESGLYDTSYYA